MAVYKLILYTILIFSIASANNYTVENYHVNIGVPRAIALLGLEVLGRIVGGGPVTTPSSFPFQAGIIATLTSGLTSICGGSLVSNTKVLTAAHCWWDGQSQAKQFTIVLGSLTIFTGGTRIETNKVAVHPNWNTVDITNDIAMVTITRVDFNNNIQSIPIPGIGDVNQDFSGLDAIVSGYGKTSDSQSSFPATTTLHHITVKVITNTDCQKSFQIPLHGSHLCTNGAGGKGSCDGDSGGPLTVVWKNRRTLIGVVSFGLGDGCESGYPSVYTRVTAFLNWINANL